MDNKNISTLSVEELLNQLENAQNTNQTAPDLESKYYDTDITSFIKYFNIKQGDNKVHSSIVVKLYNAYTLYPKTKVVVPLSEIFTLDNNKFFSLNLTPADFKRLIANYKKPTTGAKRRLISTQKVQDTFIKQLQDMGIKEGNNPIQATNLYIYYLNYCRDNKVKSRYGKSKVLGLLKIFFKGEFRNLKGNKRQLIVYIDSSVKNDPRYIDAHRSYEEALKFRSEMGKKRSKNDKKEENK